jgi:DNA polymerase I-like protein with 3'-5' exonuclease and polymerase domains
VKDSLIVDLETPSLSWRAYAPSTPVIAAVSGTFPEFVPTTIDLRFEANRRMLRDMIVSTGSLANHNLKFDLHHLMALGVLTYDEILRLELHDTMVYAALLNEHLPSYALDDIAHKYVDAGKDEGLYEKFAAVFGGKATRKAQMENMGKALLHPELLPAVESYALIDVDLVRRILPLQLTELARQDLGRVVGVEMSLLPRLMCMEHGGVRVDLDQAVRAVSTVTEQIAIEQKKLDDLAGFPVDVDSPKVMRAMFKPRQISETAWAAEDGTILTRTPKGAPSLDKNNLMRMSDPRAKQVLEVRVLKKVLGTFLKGHVLGSHENGRIYANFNQTKSADDDGGTYGTGSGRLSCNEPNLQQITKRNKKVASTVRALFLPDEGQLWDCHDWSQMDFRVMAHYLDNPDILGRYHSKDEPEMMEVDGKKFALSGPDTDFHAIVAKMTGLPRSPQPGVKGDAKAVNLGLSFGMGPGRMAKEMGLPYTEVLKPDGRSFFKPGPEAEAIFALYHRSVPGVKSMLDYMKEVAESRGYVRTILGRRCRFPGKARSYKAGAMIFQGSAADSLKVKLVEVADYLRGTNGRLMLNVHDEMDISVPTGPEGERIQRDVNAILEDFGPTAKINFRVPIRASADFGPNWWEASK